MPQGQFKRVFWTVFGDQLSRGSWRFTSKTKQGFLLHGNTVDLLGRYVYYFGVWESNLSTWIAQRLRPGDTFVDVGANVGYFSLLASQVVGSSGKVVSIEASPAIFADLEHNVALNDARNIRSVNMAVSDRDGELQLYNGPVGNSGKTSVISQAGLSMSGSIAARPLAAILTDDELNRARLFKIDVEGAEWLVVSGFATSLSRTRPDAEFVVEISPSRLELLERKPEDVLELFGKAGFNAYQIRNSYQSASYLDSSPYQAPWRLVGPINDEIDVIFSRLDRATL